jgi:hypothetical protein
VTFQKIKEDMRMEREVREGRLKLKEMERYTEDKGVR